MAALHAVNWFRRTFGLGDLSVTKLSVIVPVLNEMASLPGLCDHLMLLSRQGAEVIVVDGGSEDDSALI